MPACIPDDGRGLNPLLQNFWIVIHPPIFFLGFASTAVPFAHAISGLLRKDYKNWINVAVPWTLFTSAILGFGITLGGFWAYETLGWGGFWGWDPVENSSFIPWLVAVASVHTLLVQRRTGGFLRANFIMGMLPFLLVLYSTFLTRSGVLGDTSVHSFETPGMWVYILLVALIAFFIIFGLSVYFWRVKRHPQTKNTLHSNIAGVCALLRCRFSSCGRRFYFDWNERATYHQYSEGTGERDRSELLP